MNITIFFDIIKIGDSMNIGIASDHRGFKVKQKLTKYLMKKGYTVIDYGTNSIDMVDYPDYGILLGEKLMAGEVNYGIAICGTGIGISIACNKVKGIRCAKVDNTREAKLSRLHNDANIVALDANTHFYEIKDIVDVFLETKFSNEERHLRRIEKMKKYESGEYCHEC